MKRCEAGALGRCGELPTEYCDCCGLWLCADHRHEERPGPFDGPAPYSNWTTSRQAAEELERDGELKTKRIRVYHALAIHGPLCAFEGMQRTGMTWNTYTARVTELVERGMAVRLEETAVSPTSGKSQEKVRALPPHLWKEVPSKMKKDELIKLLCDVLVACVRHAGLRGTTEREDAIEALSVAGRLTGRRKSEDEESEGEEA